MLSRCPGSASAITAHADWPGETLQAFTACEAAMDEATVKFKSLFRFRAFEGASEHMPTGPRVNTPLAVNSAGEPLSSAQLLGPPRSRYRPTDLAMRGGTVVNHYAIRSTDVFPPEERPRSRRGPDLRQIPPEFGLAPPRQPQRPARQHDPAPLARSLCRTRKASRDGRHRRGRGGMPRVVRGQPQRGADARDCPTLDQRGCPMTPASDTPRLAFPLAVLAARIMAWGLLGIGLVAGAAWVYTRGPEAGLGLMFSFSVQVLILFAFAHFMHNGSQIAAGLFAVWCIWSLLSSIQGSDDPIATVLGYLFGVLYFVGCAGVVKGFNTKAPP